ncbi:beta-galactosidase-1-like protein 2 [Mya arenaria]|uniref:beta-galactosidase-1-like protein 2 n=1 Tax=Mya arenaria TaxID=6604 RepID=UPI0022E958C9|nr:beta-galactosidase-1-like protein 2 [Mya arenaria]
MLYGDTQRRKNKGSESLLAQAVGQEAKEKMAKTMFSRSNLKLIIIGLIAILLCTKLWQMFLASPDVNLPPPDAKTDIPVWRHTNNPQGMTKQSLNDILSDIGKQGELDFERPLSEAEKETIHSVSNIKLPNLKNVYKSTGSLIFKNGEFFLKGEQLRILSGAMHYFRVMPQYWTDRMQKMKACGLNTLETYVSWNLHEESPGNFNFEGILNIREYIKEAQKQGLHVILRPGPYVCSEWDFGGMPAWLLRDPNMKVRSNYLGYQKAVERFFNKLIPLITDLQYSNGGPIIAVQIENEFGSYSSEVKHLLFVKQLLVKNGIKELVFVSDGIVQDKTGFQVAPFYDESLPTANFMKYKLGEPLFQQIRSISPDFPLMVMEFWAGWFDHWGKAHANPSTKYFARDLEHLLKSGASVNFYMFHGGTNFGFTAGANWFNNTGYKTDVTSYDYVAPISEYGEITPKYEIIRALIRKYEILPKAKPDLPQLPAPVSTANYGKVVIDEFLQLEDMMVPVKPIKLEHPVTMEKLDLGEGRGQNFGFVVYRVIIKHGKNLKFTKPARDRVQVLLNGIQVGVFTWMSSFWQTTFPVDKVFDENILDIIVEHQGRVNYVHQGFNRFNEEHKGLAGDVLLDDKPVTGNWSVYPLPFTKEQISKFEESKKWKPYANWKGVSSLYRGSLFINGTPRDTFVNMKGWKKGIVSINGFNLGRYWEEGPQKTLYVPAPILKPGSNKIVIFELNKASHSVTFDNVPNLG